MNHKLSPAMTPPSPLFTETQGQFLVFIFASTQVPGRAPVETDFQRYFQVAKPTVHQTVLTLARMGIIFRQPGDASSIRLLVDPDALPVLRSPHSQSVKSFIQVC